MAKLALSKNKVLAGVCGGIAEYLGVDAKIVRIAWVIAAIVGVGSPIIFYLILCLVMPVGGKKDYAERMYERLGKKQ